VSYAEMRFESVFSRSAIANDGEARDSNESEAAAFGIMVRYTTAGDITGHGQTGMEIGRLALNHDKLLASLVAGLGEAFNRAKANAQEKARVIKLLAAKELSLSASIEPSTICDNVEAIFARDPRTLNRGEILNLCREASAAVSALGSDVAYNAVAA